MNKPKIYATKRIQADLQWQNYKETNNPKSKIKAKKLYYESNAIMEEIKNPKTNTTNITTNITRQSSTSILSNNDIKTKVRKNKK